MNTVLFISFLIPASVAFILITLLIKEREHLLPGNHRRVDPNRQEKDVKSRFFKNENDRPHDFLDLSGGTMGI